MISVIIRSRNEDRYIGYAIQSVLDHIRNAEIIVLDNNSTDETLSVVELFEDVTVCNIDDYTPGYALNFGTKLASYENVLFLSAHCEIARWATVDLRNYAAVFGKQIPVYQGKRVPLSDMWLHFDDITRINYYSEAENRLFLHNAFAIYNKAVLEHYPFDETVDGKEDRLWAKEVVPYGLKYLYNPNLVCYHHYTPNGNTWKYSEQLRNELVKG